jgi:hypothetical protein
MNIEYGEFQIKNDIKEGNKIGTDNSNITEGDYARKILRL